MHHLANELTEIGINLSEARFIRDDAKVIVSNIVELSTKFDYLFTSGGIGPTHDDITQIVLKLLVDRSPFDLTPSKS